MFSFDPHRPLPFEQEAKDPWDRGFWNADWVRLPGDPRPPFVSAYRLRFTLEFDAPSVRIAVAADERYILFLDSELVGRGNARGDLDRWQFETYDLALEAGRHELFAYVWSFGSDGPHKAAHAQMTLRPGFLVASVTMSELLTTGIAPWQVARLDGFDFLSPLAAWGIGPRLEITGEPTGPGGMDRGAEWVPVEIDGEARSRRGANGIFPTRLLEPSLIPAQRETLLLGVEAVNLATVPSADTSGVPIRAVDHLADEAATLEEVLGEGGVYLVPAGERRRILLRFPTYACVYLVLRTSGGPGSTVRVHVQEALYEEKTTWSKGNRNETEGKFFTTLWHDKPGIGDTFHPRGFRQDFQSFDWLAGRYAEVFVDGGERGTALFSLRFTETRYPLDLGGWPQTDDAQLGPILQICRRGLEMAAHETFIDCAYERMQYVLDTRIEGLCATVFGEDDRLVRKALRQFADSLRPEGMITSRYPARERQIIPPFGLHFVGMLHDHARWRGDREMVSAYLPTARAILDHYASAHGRPEGWNFVDWVPGWEHGVPPESGAGEDPIVILLLTLAKRQLAEMEAWVRGDKAATRLAPWPEQELSRARPESTISSEHFAALAVLLGRREYEAALASEATQPRVTYAFAHLLFEAYVALGRTDLLRARVEQEWGGMVRNGLTTTIEMPEPTRSDCHGWGAHPAYHMLTGFLGLQPVGLGGERFSLTPRLPAGVALEASAFTAHGPVHLRGSGSQVEIEVPPGVTVETSAGELQAGSHRVEI